MHVNRRTVALATRAVVHRYPLLTGLGIVCPVLLLAGDVLLPILGHVLHLAIEVLEVPLEHLLELLFHLTPRQSQGLLAWSALFALIYGLFYLARKTVAEIRRATEQTVSAWLRLKSEWHSTRFHGPATAITLTVGVLGAIVFMMF